MPSDTYQVYAVKYAHHDRRAHENFLQGDPHDTAPMPLDYFLWAIVGESRTFVLDTGFSAEIAKKRGREFIRSAAGKVRKCGVCVAAKARMRFSTPAIVTRSPRASPA